MQERLLSNNVEQQVHQIRRQNFAEDSIGNWKPNIKFIFNPAAGSKNTEKTIEEVSTLLLKHFGWCVDIWRTEYPGHARLLAAFAVSMGADIVFPIGGDGTNNEVL